MDLKKIEKVVQKIQMSLFKNSQGQSVGNLKSHFKGQGLQFKEHQIYCYGDDVRFIDWKLFAKSRTPYIKTFDEERNVDISVVLDASLSMKLGYKEISKLQVATEIACLLFLLSSQSHDTIQVNILSHKVSILPKLSGKEGIVAFINELTKLGILSDTGKIRNDYFPDVVLSDRDILANLNKLIRMKKEVVILSDFQDFLDFHDIEKLLKNRNVHCYKISSPLDENKIVPYSFFGFDTKKGSKSSKFYSLFSKSQEESNITKSKRFKSVQVDKRYLEDFVKELI